MLVTATLWWLFVGSCVWVLIDHAGIVEEFVRERNARGTPPTAMGLVLATLFTIVMWPWFVVPWLRGMWRAFR
jgi:hypothetical protein